ncbi:hypothetical protein J6590_096787 [Homalodisca vitripennis]|nr:hypothetical protein J6590_096787 [Homalodisca vitripennis]
MSLTTWMGGILVSDRKLNRSVSNLTLPQTKQHNNKFHGSEQVNQPALTTQLDTKFHGSKQINQPALVQRLKSDCSVSNLTLSQTKQHDTKFHGREQGTVSNLTLSQAKQFDTKFYDSEQVNQLALVQRLKSDAINQPAVAAPEKFTIPSKVDYLYYSSDCSDFRIQEQHRTRSLMLAGFRGKENYKVVIIIYRSVIFKSSLLVWDASECYLSIGPSYLGPDRVSVDKTILIPASDSKSSGDWSAWLRYFSAYPGYVV